MTSSREVLSEPLTLPDGREIRAVKAIRIPVGTVVKSRTEVEVVVPSGGTFLVSFGTVSAAATASQAAQISEIARRLHSAISAQ